MLRMFVAELTSPCAGKPACNPSVPASGAVDVKTYYWLGVGVMR